MSLIRVRRRRKREWIDVRKGKSPTTLVVLLAISGSSAMAADSAGPPGAVRGTIYDADFDIALPRVRISLVEVGVTVTTDDNGSFSETGTTNSSGHLNDQMMICYWPDQIRIAIWAGRI